MSTDVDSELSRSARGRGVSDSKMSTGVDFRVIPYTSGVIMSTDVDKTAGCTMLEISYLKKECLLW